VMNARILLLFGERGVAAFGVCAYIYGIFAAYFFGISDTSVTVIGYKHGNRALDEIKDLLKKGIILMLAGGVIMFVLCELFPAPFAAIFVGYDAITYDLAVHAIRIQAIMFILFGFNIYVASVFTGLEDGLSSILIAANQSLVAPIIFVFLLPALFGKEGIWYTLVAESVITAILAVFLLLTRFKKSLLHEKN
ncbi:MAG: MATE family efflux transporter, partial [Butyrivibrio sp.]|nr:MATE family efflux transporter [Butyrivibrio sp.]